MTKHKAEVAIKEIATYTDDEFVTFMNELTTLLSSEVPGAPKGKGLN
ncbi:MAG: hypothetical protein GY814_04095 [Gammaproteobacteria bacterium]|nr:hypothetical protein [Gammaproteobacteria bacterium]